MHPGSQLPSSHIKNLPSDLSTDLHSDLAAQFVTFCHNQKHEERGQINVEDVQKQSKVDPIVEVTEQYSACKVGMETQGQQIDSEDDNVFRLGKQFKQFLKKFHCLTETHVQGVISGNVQHRVFIKPQQLTTEQSRSLSQMLSLETTDKILADIAAKKHKVKQSNLHAIKQYVSILWLDPNIENNLSICQQLQLLFNGLTIRQYSDISELENQTLQSSPNEQFLLIFSNAASTSLLDSSMYPFRNVIAEYIFCGNVDTAQEICETRSLPHILFTKSREKIISLISNKISQLLKQGYSIKIDQLQDNG